MSRIHLIAALSLSAALFSEPARAYSINMNNGYVVRWPTPHVDIALNVEGIGLADDADLAAVRRGMASWSNVGCTDFKFIEGPTTTSRSIILISGRTDGRNIATWVPAAQWEYGRFVLGVTTPVFDGRGRIEEADIGFNGSISWSVSGTRGTDVEGVAVHELGHFFGMQHVLGGENMADPPTMAPAVDPQNRTRTLTEDDAQGCCFLYPKGGTFACQSTAQCPRVVDQDRQTGEEKYVGQLTCGSGTCQGVEAIPEGTKAIGDKCTSTDECADERFCQITSAGAFCTELCKPNQSTCPSGFTCVRYQSSTDGACLPSSIAGGGARPEPTPGTNPGNTPGSTPVGCTCDLTVTCDPDCACDAECGCACDRTFACDPDCDACDAECKTTAATGGGGGGCNALHESSWLGVALLVSALVWRRARNVRLH